MQSCRGVLDHYYLSNLVIVLTTKTGLRVPAKKTKECKLISNSLTPTITNWLFLRKYILFSVKTRNTLSLRGGLCVRTNQFATPSGSLWRNPALLKIVGTSWRNVYITL